MGLFDTFLPTPKEKAKILAGLLSAPQKQVAPDRSVMDAYQPQADVGYKPTPADDAIGPPAVLGGLLSLDPSDYLGPKSISNAISSIKGLPLLFGMSVSKPEGTKMIADILRGGVIPADGAKVGTLEANHATKWGKDFEGKGLLFGVEDAIHTTKRTKEGLSPEEIADIAFRATQKNAHAKVQDSGLLLTSPIKMKFPDSPLFSPQAQIREVDGNPTLFGVIPKGWKGRK